MGKVNTRERLKTSALTLFTERGFAATSIGAIESAAGLAPRAGAFYRHFQSKEALLEELAREHITETPDEFDFEGLRGYNDTRAELVALARQFEKAAERQRPYLRLIEEVRLTVSGRTFEEDANEAMVNALAEWLATKPAARKRDPAQRVALTIAVFGGWLFYLTKKNQGIELPTLERDVLIEEWAGLWASVLDDRG